jgi:triphosphatase
VTNGHRAPSDEEIEWQFDAIDMRPVERWLASLATGATADCPEARITATPKPTKRMVDTYVDTDDWRVGKSGYVLRARRAGTASEVTLKDLAPANAGLRRRVEITEHLPTNGLEALGTEGPVGRRVVALAGHRKLHQILEVRTTRRPFDLKLGQESVAEVALDDTVISAGGGQRPARLRRVEVEVASPWTDALAPIVEELRTSCGLQPASLSKFEAGLLAAGLQIPGPPDLGPTSVSSGSTLGDLAYAVLRKNFEAMLVHEPGTRLGEDPDDLHDMRVATRRMRAALSLFKEALPVRAQHVRDELGWLGRELGAVRDLDVQVDRLEGLRDIAEEDRAALRGLVELLKGERQAARARLLSSLESTRYERLVAGMVSMLRQGPPRRSPAARAPAVMVAPDLLSSRHRAATKAARRARRTKRSGDFHLLRIRCKRLRYALEFFSGIYEGQTEKMIRSVTRLQDSLGVMQDAVVAVDRLRSLATADDNGLSPGTVFVMGSLAERYRRDALDIAVGVPKHLKVLKGRAWAKLRVFVEQRRLELGALYRWPVSVHAAPPLNGPRPHVEAERHQG